MITRKFWPLDYDPEEEIFDNVSWGLPGFRASRAIEPGPKRIPQPKKRD